MKVESEAQEEEEEVSRQMIEAAQPTLAETVSPPQPSQKLRLDVRRKMSRLPTQEILLSQTRHRHQVLMYH